MGIVNVPCREMIDADELGVVLGDVNGKHGHGVKGLTFHKLGNYGRDEFKLTLTKVALNSRLLFSFF